MGLKICKDRELIKDVIQSLFLEIWEKRNQLNVTHWNAYLRKSFYRKLIQALQQKKQTHPQSIVENSLTIPSFEQILQEEEIQKEQNNKLQNALLQLGEQERKAIDLRFKEGLSYEEIAQSTGKSKQTIYNQIFQAIKKLRKQLHHILV